MNETGPVQKQDINRLNQTMEQVLTELREIRRVLEWRFRDDPKPEPTPHP